MATTPPAGTGVLLGAKGVFAPTLTPPAPANGKGYLYFKADGTWHVNSVSGGGEEQLALTSQIPVVPQLTGVVLPFAGSAAPTGWLLCDGSAVSRTTYAALFAVTGTTYGVGDGSTTFNLPDMRDRTPVGSSGTKALGTTGGAATHTMSVGELPAHNHTDSGHTHTMGNHTHAPGSGMGFFLEGSSGAGRNAATASGTSFAYSTTTLANLGSAVATTGPSTNTSDSSVANIANAGGGAAFPTQSPYLSLNHIIKF